MGNSGLMGTTGEVGQPIRNVPSRQDIEISERRSDSSNFLQEPPG